MCNVLIFIKPDNNHPDSDQDWKKFKAGDVIDIHEQDNFDWGASIQGPDSLGWWYTVIVPNTEKKYLEQLLASDPLPFGTESYENRSEIRHRIRVYKLNVLLLKSIMTSDELLSIASLKPELSNPVLIGSSPHMIG